MHRTNRNRKAECDVCGKPMRSDNLKRHKLTHKDLLSLPDNEIKDEFDKKSRKSKKKRCKMLWKLQERMT